MSLPMAFLVLVCSIVVSVGSEPGHIQRHLEVEVLKDGGILMHQEPESKEARDENHEVEWEEVDDEGSKEGALLEGEEDLHNWGTRRRRMLSPDMEELHMEELLRNQEAEQRKCRRRFFKCPKPPSKVNCAVGGWSGWKPCSKPCGKGRTFRTRGITRHAAHGGAGCPGLREDKDCNTHHCPIHCVWNGFGAWQKCSKDCGGGTQKRARGFKVAAAHGGRACAGPREESRACNTKACPIDCKYAEWGDWETCSATCGNGTRVHKREVEVEAQHGGQECEGEAEEDGTCEPMEKCSGIREVASLLFLLLACSV